jgi:hypothetical protein
MTWNVVVVGQLVTQLKDDFRKFSKIVDLLFIYLSIARFYFCFLVIP